MKERFLVLANSSDGLYGFRHELLLSLKQIGEIWVSVPNSGCFDELSDIGCKIIETNIDRRGINPIKDVKLILDYIRIIKKVKPTKIITYTIKPNIYGGTVCRFMGIPYAANITGLGTAFQKKGALRTLVTAMYKVALKKAKTVFFENAGNMQVLQDERIVRSEQCCLLNGAGVNLEHYRPAPYPAKSTPVRFLFIGRVMREKGVDELFEALIRLQNEGVHCTLDLLGYCEENYEQLLKDYAEKGLLCYHGQQKDVRPFIEEAHCFVLPSWHEGMANTNLECAAMARPLITSSIHGCKEAVVDKESGLLCEPKNADSLYECMKLFCSLPTHTRAQMGLRGRRHMEEVFDKKKVVEKTVKELEG
jgi:galacturonosyltransferase